MTESLLMFWVIPSLVCILLMIRSVCFSDNKRVDDIRDYAWWIIFILSTIYPLGYILTIAMVVMSGVLTKPISELRNK